MTRVAARTYVRCISRTASTLHPYRMRWNRSKGSSAGIRPWRTAYSQAKSPTIFKTVGFLSARLATVAGSP